MPSVMGNLTVNGVNTGIKYVRELQEGVTLEQVQKAIDGDGYDSLVYEQDGKAYVAYGDDLNLDNLKSLKQGDKINAALNGKTVNLVLFENEVNSFSEGVGEALNLGKKAVIGGGKMLANQGIQIIGAGMTLGAFARMGGAKVASTAGQSLLGKAATFAFGPAKELTGQAGKGLAKAGKWAAIIAVGTAVVGTVGYGIYGANRSQKDAGIKSISK